MKSITLNKNSCKCRLVLYVSHHRVRLLQYLRPADSQCTFPLHLCFITVVHTAAWEWLKSYSVICPNLESYHNNRHHRRVYSIYWSSMLIGSTGNSWLLNINDPGSDKITFRHHHLCQMKYLAIVNFMNIGTSWTEWWCIWRNLVSNLTKWATAVLLLRSVLYSYNTMQSTLDKLSAHVYLCCSFLSNAASSWY